MVGRVVGWRKEAGTLAGHVASGRRLQVVWVCGYHDTGDARRGGRGSLDGRQHSLNIVNAVVWVVDEHELPVSGRRAPV